MYKILLFALLLSVYFAQSVLGQRNDLKPSSCLSYKQLSTDSETDSECVSNISQENESNVENYSIKYDQSLEFSGDVDEQEENQKDKVHNFLLQIHHQEHKDNGIAIDATKHEQEHLINNMFFEGKLCLLVFDDPELDANGNFFEIQIQGKFKRQPKGPLYLSTEIPQNREYEANFITKGFVKACLAFLGKFFNTLHFSYGGKGQKPHVGGLMWQAFDQVIISNNNLNHLPKLGVSPLYDESQTSVSERRKFLNPHFIDTQNIYTFAKRSPYMDIVNWKVAKLPLIHGMSIGKWTDKIRIHMYEVNSDVQDQQVSTEGNVLALSSGPHLQDYLETVFWIEFQNGLN